jgi:hypothetical protein
MRSLWEEWEAGRLNASQKRWFESRPPEELYELATDPHELVNLTENPDYAEVLSRLQNALTDWQTRVGDLAAEPELTMAEQMWPGGIEPITSSPTITRSNGEIRIECATIGASIGYRLNEDEAWRLYTHPIEASNSPTTVEAKAVRYGWAESEPVEVFWP